MLKNNLFRRIVPLTLVIAVLTISFASYKRLIPSGRRHFVSLDHQMRNDLARALRNSLRSSALFEENDSLVNSPQEVCDLPASPGSGDTSYCLSTAGQILAQPKSYTFDRSAVFNF
jgi:hypothetical protein